MNLPAQWTWCNDLSQAPREQAEKGKAGCWPSEETSGLSHSFAEGQLLPLNIFFILYSPLWFLIQLVSDFYKMAIKIF